MSQTNNSGFLKTVEDLYNVYGSTIKSAFAAPTSDSLKSVWDKLCANVMGTGAIQAATGNVLDGVHNVTVAAKTDIQNATQTIIADTKKEFASFLQQATVGMDENSKTILIATMAGAEEQIESMTKNVLNDVWRDVSDLEVSVSNVVRSAVNNKTDIKSVANSIVGVFNKEFSDLTTSLGKDMSMNVLSTVANKLLAAGVQLMGTSKDLLTGLATKLTAVIGKDAINCGLAIASDAAKAFKTMTGALTDTLNKFTVPVVKAVITGAVDAVKVAAKSVFKWIKSWW